MRTSNVIRLVLASLLAVLWSLPALAIEPRPSLPPSNPGVQSNLDGLHLERPWLVAEFQKQSETSFDRAVSLAEDDGPDSLNEPGPDALVPHYFLPTIIKAGDELTRETLEIPFSGQCSSLPLRGPPLPL